MNVLENSSSTVLHWDRFSRVARYATVALFLVWFTGTHIPLDIPVSVDAPQIDKLFHLLGYLGLSFAVLMSWELSAGLLQPKHYFTVWLLGTVYAAFDEISQIPVGRTCDMADWLTDIVGIVLGLTLFRLTRPLLYRLLAKASRY